MNSSLPDIDECAFDATCSPNANCENTFGSYICNCNPEYYGDGKNCEQGELNFLSKFMLFIQSILYCFIGEGRKVRFRRSKCL